MEEVHAELSKGVDVAKGLRHVTPDMKAAQPAAKPIVVSQDHPAAESEAPDAKAPPSKDGESLYHHKGTWFIKNYEKKVTTVSDIKIKQNVYILNAKDSTFNIPDKLKAVQIDGANNVGVNVTSVVSLVEIFNSKKVKIYVDELCPGVSVDKSHSVEIHLSRKAAENPPTITVSSATEINIILPGKTDKDPNIYLPIPVQFIHKIKAGKIVCEPVEM